MKNKTFNDIYMDAIKKAVVMNMNQDIKRVDGEQEFTTDDVYICWFAKTLQNWKALVSTDVRDGKYYEVTVNGDKREFYVDSYNKEKNRCIKFEELGL